MAAQPNPRERATTRADPDAGDEQDPAPRQPPPLGRRLAAEVFGTFALVFVELGGAMVGSLAPDVVTSAARALAGGLVVMAMIYTIGPVSGAHINPAVSLAFAVRRVFPWREVPVYWCAEIAGAGIAVWSLRAILGPVGRLGAPEASYGAAAAFGMEIALVTLLVSVILGTATHHSVVGPNAAGAVGGTVAFAALFSRPVSGAVLNPARGLAPALAGAPYPNLWIYIAAPFIGALLAVGLAWVLHGPQRESERKAAEGDGG